MISFQKKYQGNNNFIKKTRYDNIKNDFIKSDFSLN